MVKRSLTLELGAGPRPAKRKFLKSRVPTSARVPRPGRTPISSKSLKAITVDHGALSVASDSVCVLLDPVAQGTSDIQRVGLKWRDKAVHVRGQLYIDAADTSGHVPVQLYYVWDRQPNGALATSAQILDPATSVFEGFLNLEYQDRFTILKTKSYLLKKSTWSGAGGTFLDTSAFMIDEYFTLPRYCVACGTNGGTGIISDRKSGALLLLAVSNLAIAGAEPNLNISTRVYFEDV